MGKYGLADGLSRGGEYDQAIELGQEAIDFFGQGSSHVVGCQELGRALLLAGRHEEAAKMLSSAIKEAVKIYAFVEISFDSVPLLAEALAGPQWFRGRTEDNRKSRREAKRAVRWTRIIGFVYVTLRPHCY